MIGAETRGASECELHGERMVFIELITAIGAWRMVASILLSLNASLEDDVL